MVLYINFIFTSHNYTQNPTNIASSKKCSHVCETTAATGYFLSFALEEPLPFVGKNEEAMRYSIPC
jgi:hypothetical protein